MTPDECFTEVTALLPSLLNARAFRSTIAFLPRAEAASEPPPSSDASSSSSALLTTIPPPPQLPPLHILCRESNSASPSFSPVAVDGLGSSGALSGRGYFEPSVTTDGGAIHVLSDRVASRDEVKSLLTHELVHAVDASVHALDLSTCAALACSEVRAAAAAECSLALVPTSKYWPNWYRSMCVRNVAVSSTAMVFTEHGSKCVDALFSQCLSLTASESPVPTVTRALRSETDAIDAAARRNHRDLS